jgi:Ulp1 family protease
MSFNSDILDYHGATINRKELSYFESSQWLNDSCINFVFRWFEYSVFLERKEILFMDPAVVSYIKLQELDSDDIDQLWKGLKLASRKFLFLPCNDNQSLFSSTSTHWSLLIVNTSSQRAFHLDSSAETNVSACVSTLERLAQVLRW